MPPSKYATGSGFHGHQTFLQIRMDRQLPDGE